MLLLDENLSPKLVARINDAYPGSLHVLHSRLDNSPDIEVWRYAKKQKLTIVTKDKDFLHYAIQHGYPPKLVYLTTGNAKLSVIESVLLEKEVIIKSFIKLDKESVLKIG
ncbi:DUF5615 family PIN-like protein [Endozoicomonas sp. 4G]|uniref:DUF5615 family PIN-like protein n=1 Tax=Endozoicomonas sp. 4G TaxID=2872754 RepID=UPI0020786A09|nr:DUF5615 family PIN-like protein [Endozoicomonas sp. 4G]